MPRLMMLSVLGGLSLAMPAFGQTAQSYQGTMVIQQKDVEVRSGPSKNFYPTSKLNQGDKVLVLRESKEAPGWLEIKPPPGSFSWVSGKNVNKVDAKHAFVDCDPGRPASVLPGSRLVNQAPDRESVKLTTGTIVILVNPPMQVNGETWLPIEPHSSEVRFIPKEAVSGPNVISPIANGPPNWTIKPDGYTGNVTLAEAQKAEVANDIGRARQLYGIVANTATDPNQKQYATNKLASLQQPVQGTTTSLSPGNKLPTAPVAVQKGPAWSFYGRLRDSGLKSETGQTVYVLDDGNGKWIYVATPPGKSLDDYVGRFLSVYGATMYRPDVRMQYVLATHRALP